ncbi:MAG: L-tyrosine/L-tryptophan isonitrile synthase family protein [Leifsonia sp.]
MDLAPSTAAPPLPNFDHVSFTGEGRRADPHRLLDAADRWTPVASRTISRFDVEAFQHVHGLKEFDAAPTASVDAIIEVLNDPRFRKGAAADLRDVSGGAAERIGRAVRAGIPIEVVIPSFAGRPHNPAAHRRVSPDLGELYALQRLKNVADAVQRAYPPGLIFTLILDGRAYRPFYGYSDHEAMPYGANLGTLIGWLGARRQIRTVELSDLMSSRVKDLDAVDALIRHEVGTAWESHRFAGREELVRALRQGTETTAVSAALIELYKSGGWRDVDLASYFERAESIVQRRAEHTAFEYAVLMSKLKRIDLIGSAFWGALRGTVHPKPGQYSPRLTDPATAISPWHGVAICRRDGRIVTEYESIVYQDFDRYRAVFVEGDEAPFYYEEM